MKTTENEIDEKSIFKNSTPQNTYSFVPAFCVDYSKKIQISAIGQHKEPHEPNKKKAKQFDLLRYDMNEQKRAIRFHSIF